MPWYSRSRWCDTHVKGWSLNDFNSYDLFAILKCSKMRQTPLKTNEKLWDLRKKSCHQVDPLPGKLVVHMVVILTVAGTVIIYLPSDHRIPMSGYCVEWRRCGARPTGIVAMYAVVVVWMLGSTCRGRLFTCTRWPWLVKSVVVIVFGKQALGMTLVQWTLRCLNKCMRRERVGVFVDVCPIFNISSPLNDTRYSDLLVN
jgi:hypothetical protein